LVYVGTLAEWFAEGEEEREGWRRWVGELVVGMKGWDHPDVKKYFGKGKRDDG